jgi:uncharacterized protein YqjF (DUF2071 family)
VVGDSFEHGQRKDVATPEPVTTSPPPGPRVAPLAVAFADVAFLHWRYEPDEVRPLLPPATAPDSIDSAAYVGLVAFRMRSYGEFLEFNVRTYSVDEQGRRGVVFLTMEADRLPWVLAARAAGLPYRWSRMSLARDVHVLDYRSARRWPGPTGLGTRIRIRVGEPIEGDAFDHFLTARWRLHHRVPASTVTARLAHNRWPLHAADLMDLHDDLLPAAGLPAPTGPPVSALYSPGVRGRFGVPIPTWATRNSSL